MGRLTEYHNGVAVIKNKDFKAAVEKLAIFEIVMERIIDEICPSTIDLTDNGYCARTSPTKCEKCWENALEELKGGGSDD